MSEIKDKLISGLKKVKLRKPEDPPVEALVCKAENAFGVLMAKTVGPTQKKELLEVLKEETGHKFINGTCQWGEGDVYTFVLESLPTGAAKGLKEYLKEHTKTTYHVEVRDIKGTTEKDSAGTGKPASDEELMDLFRKRFEAISPGIKEAKSAGRPEAKEMKEKAVQA